MKRKSSTKSSKKIKAPVQRSHLRKDMMDTLVELIGTGSDILLLYDVFGCSTLHIYEDLAAHLNERGFVVVEVIDANLKMFPSGLTYLGRETTTGRTKYYVEFRPTCTVYHRLTSCKFAIVYSDPTPGSDLLNVSKILGECEDTEDKICQLSFAC